MIKLIFRCCFPALLLFHCYVQAARKPTSAFLQVNKELAQEDSKIVKDAYKISVITWNLAEKSPSKKDYSFLRNYRDDDIVVIGAQECEDVRPRREEGHRSKAWRALQTASLGKGFVCLAQHRMGGLQIGIYAKKNVASKIQGTQILDVACGVGNVLTNKGAICVLLRIKGRTLALINAHLAAHLGKVKERNADYRRIVTSLTARAQPRWLNKLAALQIKKNKLKVSKSRTRGLGSLTSLSALSATNRATEIGKGLKKQYQPWIDQIWNVKLGVKSKSYNGKASPPVALIEDKKKSRKSALNAIDSRSRKVVGKNRNKKNSLKGLEKEKSPTKTRKSTEQGIKSKISMRSKRSPALPSTSDVRVIKPATKKSENIKNGRNKKNEITVEEELCPFDSVIFLGDLNYRLDLPRLEVEIFKEMVGLGDIADHADALEALLEYDQLTRERIMDRVFQGYSEGKILFQPTFKYDKGTNQFDSSSKYRPPAWTDRVLYNMAERSLHSIGKVLSENENEIIKIEKNNTSKRAVTKNEKEESTVSSSNDIESLNEESPKGISVNSTAILQEFIPQLSLKKYYSIDSYHSDHRPVCAEFLYQI